MSTDLFHRVIVPVASKEDAAATAEAITQYMSTSGGTVIAVNVIEKAGGAPDKASVEQRKEYAVEIFDHLHEHSGGEGFDIETEILYGTDVAETIIEAAHDQDATAIVFTPRGGSRWTKLLTGDVTTELVTKSDIPVIVLPDQPADEDT